MITDGMNDLYNRQSKCACYYPAVCWYLCSDSISEFALPPVLHGGKIVDCGVLKDWQKNEHKADPQINIHSFDVGHSRHGRVHAGNYSGHGEHRGDAWG